jgi:hypothetical protein
MSALRQAIRVKRGSYRRARLGMARKAPIRRTISGRCRPTGAGEPWPATRRLAISRHTCLPHRSWTGQRERPPRLPAVGCSLTSSGDLPRRTAGPCGRSAGMGRAALCLLQVSLKLTCLHVGGPGNHTVRTMFARPDQRGSSPTSRSASTVPPASSVSPTTLRSPRLPPWSHIHDEPGLPEPRSPFWGNVPRATARQDKAIGSEQRKTGHVLAVLAP